MGERSFKTTITIISLPVAHKNFELPEVPCREGDFCTIYVLKTRCKIT